MENNKINPGLLVWLISDNYPGRKMRVFEEEVPNFWLCKWRDLKCDADCSGTYSNDELTDVAPEDPNRGYIGR
jgi:hypothetical protein